MSTCSRLAWCALAPQVYMLQIYILFIYLIRYERDGDEVHPQPASCQSGLNDHFKKSLVAATGAESRSPQREATPSLRVIATRAQKDKKKVFKYLFIYLFIRLRLLAE